MTKPKYKLCAVPRGYEHMSFIFHRLYEEQEDICCAIGCYFSFDKYNLSCEDDYLRVFDDKFCIMSFHTQSIKTIIFVEHGNYENLYYANELIPVQYNSGDDLDLAIIFNDNSFVLLRSCL